MHEDHTLSRRKFLGIAAGAAAVAALPAGPAFAYTAQDVPDRGNSLIKRERMGTITYTQRDVPSRQGISTGNATMGYIGGPNFPADPTDLGPLVPLPGGWKELFEFLAPLGFTQIEFAGYGQNANNPGGGAPNPTSNPAGYLAYAQTLRGFLDANGLRAIGNHGFIPNTWPGPGSAGGGMSEADRTRYLIELDFAAILGMKYMGTGNDPTSANNRNKENWDLGIEKWIALNELALSHAGIQLYPHNHSPAYNFLQDGPMVEVTVNRITGEPLPAPQIVRGESGIRLMEYYLDNTPSQVVIEQDIYWAFVAQHQHRWYYDWEGNRVEQVFEPNEVVTSRPGRVALFHAKDGASTGQPPGVGNGYNFVPFGTGDIGFNKYFRRLDRVSDLLDYNSNYEQDNAPGGGGDPGKSLRDSKTSAWHMIRLGH